MKAELKNLKDQCNLNQLLLVERVEKIFADETERLNKQSEKIKENEKWLHFLMKDFSVNIMARHVEYNERYFKLGDYVDRVREYYHHHKKNLKEEDF